MQRPLIVVGLAFLGLAGLALFTGWAFYQASTLGAGWRTLGPIWPYAVGGFFVVVALASFLMWLAFYSARHGLDDGD